MKNLIKILFLSLIVAFVSFSCQKEVTIEADALDEKIVVEGKILHGESPEIILTKTGFYYETIDPETIEGLYIHDAVITISGGGSQVVLDEICGADAIFEGNKQLISDSLGIDVMILETLYYSLSEEQKDSLVLDNLPDNVPLPCFYAVPKGVNFIGQEGVSYDLNIVTKDNKILSSTTTIPEHFYIDSLTYEYNSTEPDYAKVLINLTFDDNQVLGKYVKFGSKKQDEEYFFGGIGGSVYSDATFAGSTFLKLPLLYNREDNDDVPLAARGNFKRGDVASLIWMNIDRATYDFLYSVENDGGASPFSSPTKHQTNINGGLGIWAGYNVSEYSVFIP